jgi:hypothetical protein
MIPNLPESSGRWHLRKLLGQRLLFSSIPERIVVNGHASSLAFWGIKCIQICWLYEGIIFPPVPRQEGMEIKIFPASAQPKEIGEYLMDLDDHLIFAMGNIVGWGHEFVDYLRENYTNG